MPDFGEFYEQINEEINAAHDHFHAVADDRGHQLETFMQELSESQTGVLLEYLSGLLGAREPKIYLASFLADLQRILAVKKKVCVVCGVNHDEEIAKMLQPKDTPEMQAASQSFTEPQFGPPATDVDRPSKAEEYGIERNPNQASPVNPWRCKNCHMPYQSVADRAMKPPRENGCEGCQQAAKYGGKLYGWS